MRSIHPSQDSGQRRTVVTPATTRFRKMLVVEWLLASQEGLSSMR
jgi:hypothetical protein